ncbi:MAG: hypothetical protein NWR67_00195 [Saprospiraceae bacterium]|jgi:DNA-binding MarR family transcriptional regulator|nr:hypothetical protein [Saprospiraceae bacterium]MDP4819397.1 hypothetical protein [Saprospiraceae bacterium]MDP4999531.1 hypothetical protein [Saprospiraceae bacterium]
MKWSLACFLWCSTLLTLYAQDDHKRAEKIAKDMAKAYDLSAVQRELVRDIQVAYFRNHREIASLEKDNEVLFIQKRRNIEAGMEQQVLKVLDERQRMAFQKFIAERAAAFESAVDGIEDRGESKRMFERRGMQRSNPER